MCSKISWQDFLLVILLVLFGCYLVIGVLFYRKDIVAWLARRRSANAADSSPSSPSLPETAPTTNCPWSPMVQEPQVRNDTTGRGPSLYAQPGSPPYVLPRGRRLESNR